MRILLLHRIFRLILRPLFFVGVLFLAIAGRAQTAPVVSYMDGWSDTIRGDTNDGYFVVTTGSFTVNISLPLDGVDIAQFNPASAVNLTVAGVDLIDDTLGDDPRYRPGKRTASFPVLDDNGNSLGALTISWTATTMNITGGLTGDALGDEANYGTAGSAGVTHISDTAEVDVSLDAFSYSAGNVVVTGQNTDIETPGPDQAGYSLERGSIHGALPTPPKINLSAPANNESIPASPPVVTFQGTLSDKSGVDGIWCLINNDTNDGAIELVDFTANASGILPTSGSWSSALDLSQSPGAVVGPNTLAIFDVSASGETSAYVTRKVTWVEATTVTLSVNPPAAGMIAGLHNGQSIVIGHPYPLAATSSNPRLWSFLEWTDGESNDLNGASSFKFAATTNEEPAVLVANFIPNPYPSGGATFDGLFENPDSLTPTNCGAITLKVSSSGAYSGSIMRGSRVAHPFSGQFSFAPDYLFGDTTASDVATVSLGRNLAVSIYLELDDLTNGSEPILSGNLTVYNPRNGEDSWTNAPETSTSISAVLVAAQSNSAAGLFNFVLPPINDDPSQGPGGYSFGTANLAKSGAVTVVLNLADGVTPASSIGTGVGANGAFPLYLPLYAQNGVPAGMLFGWMNFTNDTSQQAFADEELDLESTNLVWLAETERNFPGGFVSPSPYFVFGSRYVAPKAGKNLFGATDVSLETAPSLGSGTPLLFNPKTGGLSVEGANPDHVVVKFTPGTGAVSASQLVNGKTISGPGVLLPSLQTAYGFFSGKGNNGVPLGETSPFTVDPVRVVSGAQ